MRPALKSHRPLFALALAAIASLLATSCGGASAAGPTGRGAELKELHEQRALSLIAETLLDLKLRTVTGWQVDVGWETPLAVDLRIAGEDYGVEWLSAQDLADRGEQVPSPAPDGQLRILAGRGETSGAHVLLLDARLYLYHPEHDTTRHGQSGAREIEGRLRRDIRDFIEFERRSRR